MRSRGGAIMRSRGGRLCVVGGAIMRSRGGRLCVDNSWLLQLFPQGEQGGGAIMREDTNKKPRITCRGLNVQLLYGIGGGLGIIRTPPVTCLTLACG